MARLKGSKNKRNVGIPQELRDALGHRDPAVVLAEVYSMEQKDLAKLMRSQAGARAVAMRVQAATAAMPYAHSKMPVAVTLNDERLPVLVIDRAKHQMIENKAQSDTAMKLVGQSVVGQDAQSIDAKGKNDE